MKYLYPLTNTIQYYAWGSKDGIASFTGIANADGKPQAELWMGAHPGAPSKTITETGESIGLDALISQNPENMLGQKTRNSYGCLPYLFKILSAGAPLSLQVFTGFQNALYG